MLSARATQWLHDRGVTQRRPRLTAAAMRRYLADQDLPPWPSLLAVEADFGGLGCITSDERELAFGADNWFGKRRDIDGRPHILVALYEPIRWFMDEGGRIVEIDDLGERFYESDTIAHRIEQLALFDWHGLHRKRLEGFCGRAIAEALDLELLGEACDSRQRFWASPGATAKRGILVRESREPSDYGKRDLVELTWIGAGGAKDLARAVKAAAKPHRG